MTGFRVALGRRAGRYGVRPDLTTLGKVIGGGLPVGAYGGRADLMAIVAPDGPVYQAGTLSGNPLGDGGRPRDARPAGAARTPTRRSRRRARGSRRACGRRARAACMPVTLNRVGSMLTVFFIARGRSPTTRRRRPRHEALRPLLPRDARARRVPAARAVRGGLRLARSRRGGDRRDRRGGPRGVRGRGLGGARRTLSRPGAHSRASTTSARFRVSPPPSRPSRPTLQIRTDGPSGAKRSVPSGANGSRGSRAVATPG